MSQEEWIKSLLEVISEIGNISYQQEVWIHGKDNEVTSWDESICKIFDDYDIDGFIDTYLHRGEYTDDMKNSLISFRNALSDFSDNHEDFIEPKKIVVDNEWISVSKLAKNVLQVWVK